MVLIPRRINVFSLMFTTIIFFMEGSSSLEILSKGGFQCFKPFKRTSMTQSSMAWPFLSPTSLSRNLKCTPDCPTEFQCFLYCLHLNCLLSAQRIHLSLHKFLLFLEIPATSCHVSFESSEETTLPLHEKFIRATTA